MFLILIFDWIFSINQYHYDISRIRTPDPALTTCKDLCTNKEYWSWFEFSGSPEEKISFEYARKYVKFTKAERKDVTKVIDFNVEAPDSVSIGQDVVVRIKVCWDEAFVNVVESETVFLSLTVSPVFYILNYLSWHSEKRLELVELSWNLKQIY